MELFFRPGRGLGGGGVKAGENIFRDGKYGDRTPGEKNLDGGENFSIERAGLLGGQQAITFSTAAGSNGPILYLKLGYTS